MQGKILLVILAVCILIGCAGRSKLSRIQEIQNTIEKDTEIDEFYAMTDDLLIIGRAVGESNRNRSEAYENAFEKCEKRIERLENERSN